MKSQSQKIRRYYSDYIKWFPEEWSWEIADEESRKLYMKYRARRDGDKIPFFNSIELDANQFDLTNVEFTDIFGITWAGKKGCHHLAGAPDYECHMYYDDSDTEDDNDDTGPLVSEVVTIDNMPDGYAKLTRNYGIIEYIEMTGVIDIKYHYIVENHLFKDSYVSLSYSNKIPEGNFDWVYANNNDVITVWDIYGIAKALKEYKPDLYEKFLKEVDEHLVKLQNSEDGIIRSFAPMENGKFLTARELFSDK